MAGLWALVTFVSAAVRGRDRLAVAIGLIEGAAGLLLLLAHGPWIQVPAWIWSPLAGACGGAGRRTRCCGRGTADLGRTQEGRPP